MEQGIPKAQSRCKNHFGSSVICGGKDTNKWNPESIKIDFKKQNFTNQKNKE
jgi:hypothetical protein